MSKKITENLSDYELVNHDTKEYLLRNIIEETSISWDSNAPYQRDQCWSQKDQKALIRSILANIPIGSIHVVEKHDKSGFYYVLDAKQRLCAIQAFINNDFSVKWENKELKYKDFQLPENKHLMSKFLDHQSKVVKWEYMPLLKQRVLFEIINLQSPLNPNERVYCPRFFARLLMNYIYKNSFNKIIVHTRKEIAENKRFAGDAWVHKICHLCFGPNLTDTFAIRQLSKAKIEESALEIDKKLCNYFSSQLESGTFTDSCIEEDVIKHLKIHSQIELLKKTSNEVLECMNHFQKLEKKVCAVTLMDVISFIIEKVQLGILTIAQMTEDRGTFHALFSKYQIEKEKNNFAKHTTDVVSIAMRKVLFEKIYDELGIDQSVKNTLATADQKSIALMNAKANCPITGTALTDENVRVDHVNPKSKCGETNFCAVSNSGNSSKSNHTKKSTKQISDYICENED